MNLEAVELKKDGMFTTGGSLENTIVYFEVIGLAASSSEAASIFRVGGGSISLDLTSILSLAVVSGCPALSNSFEERLLLPVKTNNVM